MKIEVKNLTKEFKKIKVIDNINVVFESGNIYGLIGRNGSGKSVFLKILCGFYVPTEGTILYDGIDYIKQSGFPKDTRAIIEKPDFLPDLSGFDNLKLLSEIQNKINDKEILEAMEKVNLLSEKDKKYSKYSLGMKQKLGIAQVLMENPKVMFFDEPFNGIEDETVQKLRNILKEEVKNDKIIIIASHIKEDIEFLASRIYHFDNGKLSEKKHDEI